MKNKNVEKENDEFLKYLINQNNGSGLASKPQKKPRTNKKSIKEDSDLSIESAIKKESLSPTDVFVDKRKKKQSLKK